MFQRCLVAVLLGVALLACSGGGNSCVDTICTAGEKACQAEGHLQGTCADDGRSWELKACPDGTYCSGGSCVPTVCTPSQRVCYDPTAWQQCDDLGTGLGASTPCPEDTGCVHGVCLSEPCFAGKSACNGAKLITCSTAGGGWVADDCGPGRHCVQPEGAAATCQDDLCVPFSRQCEGTEGYQACLADGTAWADPVACEGGQACHNGLCTDKLCQVVQPEPDVVDVAPEATVDTTPGGDDDALAPLDTGLEVEDLPPLEVPDTGSAVINGTVVYFTMSLSGKYVAAEERVLVSMNELVGVKLYQMEVHIIPVAEFTVGEWSSADPSEVAAEIRLNDGTGDPGEGPDSYKYKATEYTVALDQFDAVGGRLKGTFSGKLQSKDGTETLNVTEGKFDVKRKN